ncbi:MAG TPA: hypothetical protein VMN58_09260 [Acidimicrobiales bacterium]|nr:hypothetical protein [Acidimicrobiales bacterium]
MREVDISDQLLPQHHEVMRCLGLLGRRIDTDLWCLVGGMMVLVAARAAGRADSRAEQTKDGDVLVDVLAEPGILAKVTYALRSLGYELPVEEDRGGDFARCMFVSGRAQVDVLAPEDTPADRLAVGSDLRSLAIPGGRRALDGAELTTIYYAEDQADVVIRVPSLTGAICVKAAAAVDQRTTSHPRHIQDVAFLLACIDDPVAAANELTDDDRALLSELRQQRLGPDDDIVWRYLDADDQARAEAAFDFLIGD